jgi:hypothetical protein
MVTFLISLIIMIAVVGPLAGWAIREQRRRIRALDQANERWGR